MTTPIDPKFIAAYAARKAAWETWVYAVRKAAADRADDAAIAETDHFKGKP